MADLAVRRISGSYERPAVLPRFQRVIIDEAHRLEDVATDYFGFDVSKFGIIHAMRRLISVKKKKARGLLPFLVARLKKVKSTRAEAAVRLVEERLIPERRKVESALDGAMERIAAGLKEEYGRENGERGVVLRIVPEVTASGFWRGLVGPVVGEAAELVEGFSDRLGELVEILEDLPQGAGKKVEPQRIEIAAMRHRLRYHVECLSSFLEAKEGVCRWLELKRGKRRETLKFCAAPIDISEAMRESLYRRFGTIVMTSATLTVGGSFDYIAKRLGLDGLPEGKLDTAIFPSSFDFRTQAFVGAPTGITPPDGRDYEEMLERLVLEAVEISGGGAFVLFTSYRLLRRLFERLEGPLAERGMKPMAQGSGDRTRLLNRFRRGRGAVLFATDSFWEGVDVRGSALRCVILTRLPFRVPSEPIQQARVEAIEKAGGDPFMGYSVPQAVIKFRQGFGRLIRHRGDTGAVLILDGRVNTRRYGRLFLKSLPDVSICRLPPPRMFAEMRGFFESASRNSR